MAENSKIEWCHHTFNPWTGCTKIGPGCDHCYAEGWAKRSGIVQWGPGAERRRTSEANWRQPVKWNAEAERLGVRYRVFCASLADVFDNEVPADWRADLFDLIAKAVKLDGRGVTNRMGNGEALDSTGTAWIDGKSVSFTNAIELSAAIAASNDARGCYAKNWMRYAYQRQETKDDACDLEAMSTNLGKPGYSMREMISDLTQTDSFRHRPAEEAP